jgi:hypothetical protein
MDYIPLLEELLNSLTISKKRLQKLLAFLREMPLSQNSHNFILNPQ